VILRQAATAASFLAAASFLVDGGPGTPAGFAFWDASLFVTLLDVFGLALLLAGVTGSIAAWHGCLRR
jgi:hypothetical protein